MNAPISQFGQFPPDAYPVRDRFSFSADVEQIPTAVDRIADAAVAHGFDEEAVLELRLALQEVLANAVVHGSGSDASKQVHCATGFDSKLGLLVKVRDEGSGFDESTIPSPLEQEGLDASHGRGLYLIRKLVDEVWLSAGGSEIWLRKNLRPRAA